MIPQDLNYHQFLSNIKNRLFVRIAIKNDGWVVHLVVHGGSGYGHFTVSQNSRSPLEPPQVRMDYKPLGGLWDILMEWSEISSMWVECTHEVVVSRVNAHVQTGIGTGHPEALQILAMTLSELARHEDAELKHVRTMNERLCHLINNINMGAHQYGGNPIRLFRT